MGRGVSNSPSPLRPAPASTLLYDRRITAIPASSVPRIHPHSQTTMRISTLVLAAALLLVPGVARAQDHGHAHGRAIHFPDVPGYLTLAVDLHMHTVFSDGSVWPDIRVAEAVLDGLDAIAVTDHLEYLPYQDDIPFPDRNRSHDLAEEYAEGTDLIVIRGAEVTRDMPPGHANAVFLEDVNPLNVDSAMDAFRAARAQGAFIFWNHPMWEAQVPSGIASLTDLHRRLMADGMLHGIEIVNMHRYSDEALQIALDHDLTMLGNSDVHGLIDWMFGVPEGGHRPVTLVFAEERTAASLRDALFAGRTVVFFDDQLVGREEHLRPLLEASIVVGRASYERDDRSILVVDVENRADVDMMVRNVGDITLHEHAHVFTLPAHETTRLMLKLPRRVATAVLALEVLNAVTAPDTHPTLRLELRGLR